MELTLSDICDIVRKGFHGLMIPGFNGSVRINFKDGVGVDANVEMGAKRVKLREKNGSSRMK